MPIKYFIAYPCYILQHANDLMAASSQRGGTTFNFRNEQGRIQRELQAAKKDNDFIYHDKVPDVKTLPAIGKATIAKPSPLPASNFSDKFQGNCLIHYRHISGRKIPLKHNY